MTPIDPDDDGPLAPDQIRRMIRRMIANVCIPVDRAAGPPSTAARAARPIRGYDTSDPHLAEILAELEAKRLEGQGQTPHRRHKPAPRPRPRRPGSFRKGGGS